VGTLDITTSSQVPSDETYVGPRAFSEPETQAIRDLVGCERFAGAITYHLDLGTTTGWALRGHDGQIVSGTVGAVMCGRLRLCKD
jgi:Zinc carboxypeptidase